MCLSSGLYRGSTLYSRPLRSYKNCMRRYASVRLLSLLILVAPLNALALGLGDMNVHSALNQPLDAEIELRSAGADELDSLTVALASSSAFDQAGIARPSILTQLQFEVKKKSGGKPYLHVFTQDPVREPFLNYLIEVNWASGHMLREYTVLLDPAPELAINAPTAQAPIVSATNTVRPPPKSQSLFEPRPAKQEQADAAPVSSTPQSSVQTDSATRTSSYGPTRAGEGLWSIAKSLLPADGSVDVNQMMLALIKANPDAFLDNNINTLKSGYNLRVPAPSEITALSQEEARSLVKQQSEHWKDRQHRIAVKTAPPPSTPAPTLATASEPAPTVPGAPTDAAAESNAQLKLVPATDTPFQGTSSPNQEQGMVEKKPETVTQPETMPATPLTQAASPPGAAQGSELDRLRKDMALANESLEAKRLENEELSSRLAELETQTASTQRLITLKNDELAALQKSMVELKGGNAAESPAKPTEAESRDQLASTAALPAPSLSDRMLTLLERAVAWLRNTMDEVKQKPMLQAAIGLGILLLIGGLLLLRRRRRSSNNQVIEAVPPPVNSSRDKAALAMAALLAAPTESMQGQAESPEVVVTDELPPHNEDRFEQALGNPDDRHQVQLKLLDIYRLTNSRHAFAVQAEALYADLAGRGGPVWDKVVAMGREVCPDHPLFAADGPSRETYASYMDEPAELPEFKMASDALPASDFAAQVVPEEFVEDTNSWQREPAPGVDNLLEFESGFAQAGTGFDTDQANQKPKADLGDWDFTPASYSLETEANEKSGPAEWQPTLDDVTPTEPAPAPIETTSYDFDYKFDLDLEKEADLLAKANAELLPEEDDLIADGLDFDASLLINSDEVTTKLELARAYIEMGDPEGAQSILDEVMKEGDEGQRQQAQELIQRVG